ncbi:MAG: ATP-binding protein [Bacteroidota bacterium]
MFRPILRSKREAYRFLTFVGGVFLLTIGIIFPGDPSESPVWMRLGVPGLLLAIGPLSYFFSWVRNRVFILTDYALVIVMVWLLYLLYRSHFNPNAFISYLLLNFSLLFVINTQRSLLVVSAVSIVGLGLVTYFTEDPQLDSVFAFGVTVPTLIIGGIAIYVRINTLRQSYEKLNFINYSAVGASRDGILLVDTQGNFIRANPLFHEYMDVPEVYIQQNMQQAAFESACRVVVDADRLGRFLNRPFSKDVIEAGEEFELQNGLILEISYIWVFRDEEAMGRMWFFKDVTQRKRYEQGLIESERRSRERNAFMTDMATHPSVKTGDQDAFFAAIVRHTAQLLQADSVTIWLLDHAQNRMVSRKCYLPAEDRYSEGTVISFRDFPGFYAETMRNRLLMVPDTRQHSSIADFARGEYTAVALSLCNGQIRAGDELIGILNVETREPRHWSLEDQNFIGSVADLAALSIEQYRRRQISEKLQRFNAVLTTTFELSETGILVIDEDREALHYNDLYLRIWNMTPEFIAESTYEEKMAHILGQIKPAPKASDPKPVAPPKEQDVISGIIEFKDGRVVERYSKAIELREGVFGRVWFYLDVTDRTKKEKELIERNFELDSFVYRASHDLKAPLNSIMGLIGIIREENELAAILRYVALMDKSVKKLEEFIRQLTQFSQDVRLQVVRKRLRIDELVQEVWQGLGFMENADRIRFTVHTQGEADFFGDPVRLSIVLNNLISNGIKYQDHRKPLSCIEVGIEVTALRAIISVQDNGVGIPADHLAKVFDLFFRASLQAPGSGLGLYITRNATEKMGGYVRVESEPGQGTLFKVILPNHAEESVAVEG